MVYYSYSIPERLAYSISSFIKSPAVVLKQMNFGMGHSKVTNLLFAEEIVLIAEKENELQTLIHKLHVWCITY